jgi:hypothetical protein
LKDLIHRAQAFATQAHQRINHQRKYTKAPYVDHLAATAKLVASVTDDPETIAAAWLHDTVEDTAVTIEDVQAEFGESLAELVLDLTDVSTSSDGNRSSRKAIDLQHLACASPRAKTVKLADLINNCIDITKHDARFSIAYLSEMAALLDVLSEGHPELYALAQKTHTRCAVKMGLKGVLPSTELLGESEFHPTPLASMVPRLFVDAFSSKDIAMELYSFDAVIPSLEVRAFMEAESLYVIGIRSEGRVVGYVREEDLDGERCGEKMQRFRPGQVLSGDSTLTDLIQVLTRHSYCFVSVLDGVVGVITRDDMNKPTIRMWLFGIVTIIEMHLTQSIKTIHADDAWQSLLTRNRLDKALSLYNERRRRKRNCELLDCLQLSDKMHILLQDAEFLTSLGFDTSKSGKRAAKELESLRNNLAHSQDIVIDDWPQIARLSRQVEDLIHGAH